MRQVVFNSKAFEEFVDWSYTDKVIFKKIASLIREIQRTPFEGLGNPEPLKHNYIGLWSRRITQEHRLIYEVSDESIKIISCKYHYQNN